MFKPIIKKKPALRGDERKVKTKSNFALRSFTVLSVVGSPDPNEGGIKESKLKMRDKTRDLIQQKIDKQAKMEEEILKLKKKILGLKTFWA